MHPAVAPNDIPTLISAIPRAPNDSDIGLPDFELAKAAVASLFP